MELVVSKCLEALAATASVELGAIEKAAELGKALDDEDDAEVDGTTCWDTTLSLDEDAEVG